jgi:hypothetical protein
MRLIVNNPEILAKNPSMLSEILGKVNQDMEISFVSFKPSHQETNQLDKQLMEQVDAVCGRIKADVVEQVRSEISNILGATRSQVSARSMIQAMGESMKKISLIREVRKVYVFTESENLRFMVIHDSDTRIGTLRRIAAIENWLDATFEDLYFEFDVLHVSEVNDNLTQNGLLIFERT